MCSLIFAKKGFLDYVAMDIKAGKSHYAHVSGRTGLNLERIDQSIRFLLNGSVPFEFRTTVVKGLHDKSDFEEIGPWIQGCGQYFLQSYQESGQVLSPDSCKSFPGSQMGGICPDCIPLCRNRQAPWNRLIHAWPVSPYFPY